MRHRHLHATLAAFAEESAWQFASIIADGVEVPFEVVEARGKRRDTPLYCYRPLTQRFIRERGGMLGRLPSYPAAARALQSEDGLGDYLRAQGEARVPIEPRERADVALRVFIGRVFLDASDFILSAERFERAWRELLSALQAGGAESVVVAPLLGVVLGMPEVPLGDGMSLLQPEGAEDAPRDAVRLAGEHGSLVVIEQAERPGGPGVLLGARLRLRRLVGALRLYDEAAPALAGVAWTRSGTGPWSLVPMREAAGRPRRQLTIAAGGEDELRAFCSLVERRAPRGGEVAWAFARHGMGCDRTDDLEALSDHLLGLRALLEPEGSGSNRLAGRLAALCAAPEDRHALADEVVHAVELERAAIAGVSEAPDGTGVLVERMAGHLRALLRDVLCGHLDGDLCTMADRLLAAPSPAPSASSTLRPTG